MSEELQREILARLEGIERMLGDRVPRSMEDVTRPLTAAEAVLHAESYASGKINRRRNAR